jgi:serine/threonine protein kinase/6-phosphogluconolactonase (cycloisomerase 2 family)
VSDNPSGSGEFAIGSQIAGYRLEEQIGRGGMAVVYRALDIRLDRRVALKILAPGLALDEAFRQRFIRESRAAAAVDHPHIIPVFEAGEAAGVLFIAMRYVRGGDVRTLLDQVGPLPAERAADIINQVASALDAAHAFGLVHRDVKPANMLLGSIASGGQADHVYLSDFGLSKQSLAVTGLTSTGQFLGTLDYVAPEQIEGRPVDGRADLYALACASFEMLGGAPPFRRDQGVAVMWAQLSEDPPSLRERRPELPAPIDAVLSRAMAKAPDDRYPTCLAFAAALREALGLRASPSGPPVAPEPRHPQTEISSPGAGGRPAAAAGTAAASGPEPGASPPAGTAGPPTQAARVPAGSDPGRTAATAPPARGGTTHPQTGDMNQPPGGPDITYDRSGGAASGGGRRPWWRSPAAIVVAIVIVLGGAGGAFAALSGKGGSGGGGGNGGGGGGTPAVAAKMPGCSTDAAKTQQLTKVRTATTHLGDGPFGVILAKGGKYGFVTLGNSIAVLKTGSSLAPQLIRKFSAPGASKSVAMTSDGKYLIAAANSGAYVISVQAAEQGSANPIVGTLTSDVGKGAVEVAVAPGDKFVFVTLQHDAAMVVFNLGTALTSGFGPSDVVGKVPLGQQPVGMVISPDGNWLYATSMTRTKTTTPSQGTVSVVDVHKAEANPAKAVKSVATAGCSPVRVILSSDGKDLWVTSRESDSLLGFSTARLLSGTAHALIARVDVGVAPIGEVLVNNESRILVANSNVHGQKGAVSSVSVVNTAAALAGRPALLGVIKTGDVPREFAVEANGHTVLLTNNNAHQVQAIDAGTLP